MQSMIQPVVCYTHTPTGPFEILESQDLAIGDLYGVLKRLWTDFEAQKL